MVNTLRNWKHPPGNGDPWLDTWLDTNPIFIDVHQARGVIVAAGPFAASGEGMVRGA